MDQFKAIFKKIGGKIRVQNLHNPNFNDPSNRELVINDYNGFKIAIDDFGYLFDVNIYTESNIILAVNNPEKIFAINQEIEITNLPYKFFIQKPYDPFEYRNFALFWNPFSKKIREYKLAPHESIFILGYQITLALNPNRDLVSIIDEIVDLLNENPAIFANTQKQRIFKQNIPDSLKHFIPLLKKWSLADDIEREQLLEESTESQKKKLIQSVQPHFKEINIFLDSFKDNNLSYEATLFGNLAELVSELMINNNLVQ